jgi:pimeloyl-ACP methyl ester carboxylesterase
VTRHIEPATALFTGAADNRLVADVCGEHGEVVLLLHGGGQTRHAWRLTTQRLAQAGWVTYALDQRGHGDSAWASDGGYAAEDFAADAKAVALALRARGGRPPAVVGASLGGIAAMLAHASAAPDGVPLFSALVLVDITPRMEISGIARIQGFMRAHASEGFAAISDAAEAVASYLPHRPRPRSHDGLKKNLRLYPDGRWRWHWDPRFLDGPRPIGEDRAAMEEKLVAAARAIEVPTLLVRGGSSELVQEAHARDFLALVPHARYVDVAGARHMVAGDHNDRFSAAVIEFLGTPDRETAEVAPPKAMHP